MNNRDNSEGFNFHVLSEAGRMALSRMYEEISCDAMIRGKLEAYQVVMKTACADKVIDKELVNKLITKIKNDIGVTFDMAGNIVDADDRGIRALSTLTSTH